MRRLFFIVVVLVSTLFLTSCKESKRIEQCFVEGNYLNNTSSEQSKTIAEIKEEVDIVSIVKLKSVESDEYEAHMGNTNFKIEVVKSFALTEIEDDELSFKVYCRDESTDDVKQFKTSYFYGANAEGLILLDTYYLVFIEKIQDTSKVKYYYILDDYDITRTYNDQTDYINGLTSGLNK